MAITAVKVWIAGEVLFASDLNAEFGNIYDNGPDSLATPRTADFDMDGWKLILDANGDTSIQADTPDQIDVEIGGSDVLVITATDIQFLGESLMRRGDLRRLGIATTLQRLGTAEARLADLESSALTAAQLTNF